TFYLLFIFFLSILRRPLRSTLFPYTTLFRSNIQEVAGRWRTLPESRNIGFAIRSLWSWRVQIRLPIRSPRYSHSSMVIPLCKTRSEEHTSELQSRSDLVCRLLLEKKKKKKKK